MIKPTNFSPKLSAKASYYTQTLAQFDKFYLFFLSPHRCTKPSNIILVVIFIFSLVSCGQQTKKINSADNMRLSSALAGQKYSDAKSIMRHVPMEKNAQNIIKLYLMFADINMVKLNSEINYLQQSYPKMSSVHQTTLNEIKKWISLKQIYRDEISPPIRILQRDKLYLAPSKINFTRCNKKGSTCSSKARKKLSSLMTNNEISKYLKKMALKDPCVNLSSELQGQKKANLCLRKSKGKLKVELLSLPRFSTQKWQQIISS